ncbi:hypothetical protein EMIHUDRAFT_260536 [Emiliania huxleyi CCMP1516]|uniref:ShKT domain-containing protein n=2 Tax=Emiliania huxleyi TaxID=2903 RepID=A0A0D3KTM1_EMIH1|nr:hypothetical protein EMIHUDRAFT_260536 [Emiliania huxleyi CCMP1516]EOD39106.1 hypothetical protein EMIHUDRAFT_260536 [Emiliania huxleyi CCMP1516]|eukprot:XP_005791535.1 hypothetical protein EMIHUDRAFT_260536 [Emiliania huxleyi CCMP1516]
MAEAREEAKMGKERDAAPAMMCSTSCDRRAAQPHDESEAHIDDSIQDKNLSCSLWAAAGECTRNPKYMKDQCARSCAKYMAELRAMPDS